MFESNDAETILERMLDRVDDAEDKRESTFIYAALSAFSLELEQFYGDLDTTLNESFADTATYTYLIKRAAERNLFPNEATKAILKGVFTPDSIDIPIDERFYSGDLSYYVISKLSDGVYTLECETEGVIGNQIVNDLIPIGYVDGLETGELTEVLIPGEDEQDIDDFRNEYFESFESQEFGGNRAQYKKMVKDIPGVGGVKIYRAWNGAGTIKLVIMNTNYEVPSSDLICNVQETIDPFENQGEGLGFAPIDHVVTVEGIKTSVLNIDLNITFQKGWNWDTIKNDVEILIDQYFQELACQWEDNENLIVRISQIENRVLNLGSVLDVSNIKIDGIQQNKMLDSDCIPIRGEVNG